ncbi:MAG: response regulator, partial [Desulfobacula sp.]|nr:response regulator [Desulfobacula sp.]
MAENHLRILVVDDQSSVRELLKAVLGSDGHAVEVAPDGESGIEMLAEGFHDLVIMDIRMPGIDGVEALRRMKEASPDCGVIMMTAYASVETAVGAMKQGALDYLTKPFDPDVLISMALKVYHEFEIAEGRVEQVDSLILTGGTQFFRPQLGKNPYGYGVLPGVVTGMEFERLISGTGPGKGLLTHPKTGKPVRKIAWFQCVGSRDVQAGTQFCSSVCCMISIKEAILAKEKFGPDIEATLFYMDMRTFGKSFDEYRLKAEKENQVRFIRARIHSLDEDSQKDDTSLLARYVDIQGNVHEDDFDLVVLATGQRPNKQMTDLASKNSIETNQWGFITTEPFSMIKTSREGILSGGSLSGLKDISDSVTCASAAALGDCKIMHEAGKKPIDTTATDLNDIGVLARENPRILTVLCSCGNDISQKLDLETIQTDFSRIPENESVEITDKLCTDEG